MAYAQYGGCVSEAQNNIRFLFHFLYKNSYLHDIRFLFHFLYKNSYLHDIRFLFHFLYKNSYLHDIRFLFHFLYKNRYLHYIRFLFHYLYKNIYLHYISSPLVSHSGVFISHSFDRYLTQRNEMEKRVVNAANEETILPLLQKNRQVSVGVY